MKKTTFMMMMMWATMAVAPALITSCSKEDDPEFDFTDPEAKFMPADSCIDEISQLRRQFYADHGSFLLFNDTLSHEFIGTDINGDARYKDELLDIKYEVGQTSTATYKPTYSYLATAQKCSQAVEYLEQFILPHLSTRLMPYSWFLAGNIYDTNTLGHAERPYALSGQRSIALACAQLSSLKTDAQKKQLAARHLLVIVQNLANNNASTFSNFCAVVSSYYGTDLSVPDGETTLNHVRSLGFISNTKVSSYPTQSADINAYASLVITYTDEQIEKVYSSYPLIISRAKMFREALESLGYIY